MNQFISMKKIVRARTSLLCLSILLSGGSMPILAESPPSQEALEAFNPLETPEQRVVEEWEKLGIIPEVGNDIPTTSPEAPSSMPPLPNNNTPSGQVPTDVAPITPELENQSQLKDAIEPVGFGHKPVLIKPSFSPITLQFDNDEAPSIPNDPNDPTSEGGRKHGGHKGGAKLVKHHTIPIIRMAENNVHSGGVKIIKPWNS